MGFESSSEAAQAGESSTAGGDRLQQAGHNSTTALHLDSEDVQAGESTTADGDRLQQTGHNLTTTLNLASEAVGAEELSSQIGLITTVDPRPLVSLAQIEENRLRMIAENLMPEIPPEPQTVQPLTPGPAYYPHPGLGLSSTQIQAINMHRAEANRALVVYGHVFPAHQPPLNMFYGMGYDFPQPTIQPPLTSNQPPHHPNAMPNLPSFAGYASSPIHPNILARQNQIRDVPLLLGAPGPSRSQVPSSTGPQTNTLPQPSIIATLSNPPQLLTTPQSQPVQNTILQANALPHSAGATPMTYISQGQSTAQSYHPSTSALLTTPPTWYPAPIPFPGPYSYAPYPTIHSVSEPNPHYITPDSLRMSRNRGSGQGRGGGSSQADDNAGPSR